MSLGIGIDTGGTYTDAVIYDYKERKVLAKGKSLTTKENLCIGIGGAMDCLPVELLGQAKIIALSTTLATNACVENKGGRAKLVLMGTSKKVLDWIDSKNTYGLKMEDILCIDSKGSFDGKILDEPDWDSLIEEENEWFSSAQALSIAELYALRNGAICEKNAKAKLAAHYDVPIVMANELVSGLNVMERGATALLNAKLLPVIADFMKAVSTAMKERGLDIPSMIVRSDGSLMVDQLSFIRPVETILSGPASSVLGGRGLTHCENCLIIDMGGTTTDISIVCDNTPAMTDGIRIGGWRTQIKGVFIDTFGLGGDSRVFLNEHKLALSERRVEPLCVAATKWPEIKTALKALLEQDRTDTHPLYEFLYLVSMPKDCSRYHPNEIELMKKLKAGPLMLGSDGLDLYNLKSERLEDEGVIMRCGLTPTDVMHIRGDFSLHDREASVLAARYFLNALPQYEDTDEDLIRFSNAVYDKISQRLYENIVRILIINKYPQLLKKSGEEQLSYLISQSWLERHEKKEQQFFQFDFSTSASLIGIGAPTHIFLPEVAKALGASYIIPEHAEVANAVGAIIADISAKAVVEVFPNYTSGGPVGYTVLTLDGNRVIESLEEAIEEAKKTATSLAIEEAKRRGALGELSAQTRVNPQIAYAKGGSSVDLGTTVTAVVQGRISM